MRRPKNDLIAVEKRQRTAALTYIQQTAARAETRALQHLASGGSSSVAGHNLMLEVLTATEPLIDAANAMFVRVAENAENLSGEKIRPPTLVLHTLTENTWSAEEQSDSDSRTEARLRTEKSTANATNSVNCSDSAKNSGSTRRDGPTLFNAADDLKNEIEPDDDLSGSDEA